MHHNERIIQFGACSCHCHKGKATCGCGIPAKIRAWFNPKPKTRKPRRVNLESRVKPFARQRGNVMSYATSHGFHALRLETASAHR